MNTFSKILYAFMLATLIVSYTTDFVLDRPIDLWKVNCTLWVGVAILAELRVNKIQKEFNDFINGSNK